MDNGNLPLVKHYNMNAHEYVCAYIYPSHSDAVGVHHYWSSVIGNVLEDKSITSVTVSKMEDD